MMRKSICLSLRSSLAAVAVCLFCLPALVAQDEEVSRANLPDIHSAHVGDFELDCTDCHAIADNPQPGEQLTFSVRPMHEKCEVCHEDTFNEGEFVTFCLTCHIDDSFDLGDFPSGNFSLGDFNHQKHLDPQGRVSAETGVRQDCRFCHSVSGGAGGSILPGHAQCIACHAGDNTVHPTIDEDATECVGCHSLEKIDHTIKTKGMNEMAAAGMLPAMLPAWLTARTQAQGMPEAQTAETRAYAGRSWRDVKPFPHQAHFRDRNGDAIDCLTCHESVLASSGLGTALRYPTMALCADCHNSRDRVGTENHISNCEVCHNEIRTTTKPGENGLISDIRHDRGFLVSHQTAARDSDAYCSYCHGLSREDGTACAECHSTMRPETHTAARFSETTHGRLAAMDRENCAVCHESDFCVRCHNIPPRSHNPLPLFVGGFHRELAALNLRSCFACHEFEADCQECHARELRLPGN